MNLTAPAQNSNGWGRNDDNNSILKIGTSHAFNIILREHCGLSPLVKSPYFKPEKKSIEWRRKTDDSVSSNSGCFSLLD